MAQHADGSDHGLIRELEEILFACLERPPAERQAALAAACDRYPERAEALRRCWQHIQRMQRQHRNAYGGWSPAPPGEDGAADAAGG